MMAYGSLDTNALIWAIKDQCTPGQEEMKRRARYALAELERDRLSLIVSSVVASELVVPMTEKAAGQFMAELAERFIIASLDGRAASIAAKLWRAHAKFDEADQAKRSVLKADVLIIASVYSAGARVFYSHDRACRKLASVVMEARDLPIMGVSLYDALPASEPRRTPKKKKAVAKAK